MKIVRNKELSDAAYVNHGLKGGNLEFTRVKKDDGNIKFPILTMLFDWDSGEEFPLETKDWTQVDKEVGRKLLSEGLFHLRDNFVINFESTIESGRSNSHSSYSTNILIFAR